MVSKKRFKMYFLKLETLENVYFCFTDFFAHIFKKIQKPIAFHKYLLVQLNKASLLNLYFN